MAQNRWPHGDQSSFVDALRECLGLRPLYNDPVQTTRERFFRGTFEDVGFQDLEREWRTLGLPRESP
jgi:hypothetical protein